MKILFHGNKDSGSILLFSIVMLALLVLCAVPVMQKIVQRSSFEKKQYEKICAEIEKNNTDIRAAYEVN
jgi:hypothetical protein